MGSRLIPAIAQSFFISAVLAVTGLKRKDRQRICRKHLTDAARERHLALFVGLSGALVPPLPLEFFQGRNRVYHIR